MFDKITKKEFINTLCNNESTLLCSYMNLYEDEAVKVVKALENLELVPPKSTSRTVVKKQTNAIQFSNGSWLYFNEIKDCSKGGNVIITYNERYDDFDDVFKCDIMAYYIY